MTNINRIFEVNAVPFLAFLKVKKLNDIPDEILDTWKYKWEFDAIYLMGIWERTSIPWEGVQGDTFTDNQGRVWKKQNVITSAFAIKEYAVAKNLGGTVSLKNLQERLHNRGMKLFLDFVPNHTARDHEWMTMHPEYYIQEKNKAIVSGKSSNSEIWRDTAQLNYHNPKTQAAMSAELRKIQTLCDGVRCDMAHLVLNKKFDQIWSGYSFPPSVREEFWNNARKAVGSEFYLLAESYGDTEYDLIQAGFDAVMDKDRFYDRLRNALVYKKQGEEGNIEGHIRGSNSSIIKAPQGEKPFGAFMVKFLENHDEERATKVFGSELEEAVEIMVEQFGNPQGPLFFHNGQLKGASIRIPVMINEFPYEEPNESVLKMYEEMLGVKEDWQDFIPKKSKPKKERMTRKKKTASKKKGEKKTVKKKL